MAVADHDRLDYTQSGKVNRGDLVTMISATFGDEMWSARNAGLGMIMQAIKVFVYVWVVWGGWVRTYSNQQTN